MRIHCWPISFENFYQTWHRADSRFAPSQWEMALLCNNGSHWLGANLESAQSPSKSLCHRSSFWRRFVTYAIFWLTEFSRNILYPLAIIHMEHINVLDFDDKSERNLCFSFGNLGIIFNGASVQLFPPREKWLFGWVRGHPPANGGRD